jgi:hypothetical protein
MKIFIKTFFLLMVAVVGVSAQWNTPAPIRYVPELPPSCSPLVKNTILVVKYTDPAPGLYICSAVNAYTLVGTGDGPTGIGTFNGLSSTTQSLAIGATDTAAWSSLTSTHTLGLPITAVSGSSRTSYFPYFNGANTFATSPFSWNGTSYQFRNTTLDDTFGFSFTPTVANTTGSLLIGSALSTSLELNDGLQRTTLFAGGDIDLNANGEVLLTSPSTVSLDAQTGKVYVGSIFGTGGKARMIVQNDLGINAIQFYTGGTQLMYLQSSGIVALTPLTIQNKINITRTITTAGTTGNQTINKVAGTVNFAAGTGTAGLTVTNSYVDASSIIVPVTRTNDATCAVKNVVPAAGSFIIRMTANCTAETSVGFIVTN